MKWHNMILVAGFSVTSCFGIVGCGSHEGTEDTADGGITDARPDTDNKFDAYVPPAESEPLLVVDGLSTIGMKYGETKDLRIRYYDKKSDKGLAGAAVEFAVKDNADTKGSSLTSQHALTNDEGRAGIQIISGNENVNFLVTAKVDDGNKSKPVTFHISVNEKGETPLGKLHVTTSQDASLAYTSLSAMLYRDKSCKDFDANSLPTPLSTSTTDNISNSHSFETLQPSPNYAVAVKAQIGSILRGYGCVDSITVVGNETTTTDVKIEPTEWGGPVQGTYLLSNQLDFGDSLPGSVGKWVRLVSEIYDDQNPPGKKCDEEKKYYGRDPGAFVTDLLVRQTCAWECAAGQSYAECSSGPTSHAVGDAEKIFCHPGYLGDTSKVAKNPTFGFLPSCGLWEIGAPFIQDQVNAVIDKVVPKAIQKGVRLISEISSSITHANIKSTLVVQKPAGKEQTMTHKLDTLTIQVHDFKDQLHTFDIELKDPIIAPKPVAGTLIVKDDFSVTVPKHSFQINYGQLVKHIYLKQVLPKFGFNDGTASMLQALIPCRKLAQSIHDKWSKIPGFVTVDVLTDICNQGLAFGGNALDNKIDDFIKGDGTLTLEGTCNAENFNEDGIAKSLANGKWSGGWKEDAETGQIKGVFTGTRQ